MYNFSIEAAKGTDTLGFKNLEVDEQYFGAPLYAISPADLENERAALIKSTNKVVLYTSDLCACQYDKYVVLFKNAHLLGIENVKLSFKAVEKASAEQIKKVIEVAAAFNIKVLFELMADSMDAFGFEQYAEIRSEATGLIFNPNEFVKLHKNPFLGVFYKTKYRDDVVILRVRDMLYDSLTPMPIEKGNAEVKEIASILLCRSFKGYFSFGKYGDDISVESCVDAFTTALCKM